MEGEGLTGWAAERARQRERGQYFVISVCDETGEVSDSESDNVAEEFDDGLDENLIRDDEDRKRLESMTEKEREQELFNRIEKREVLRTR